MMWYVRLFIAMSRIQGMSDMSMLVTNDADVMFISQRVFDIFDPNAIVINTRNTVGLQHISTLIQSELDRHNFVSQVRAT